MFNLPCPAAARCCATSAVNSANVSRSGRLIKPPLEYWKGARVILDCDINVTIHGGYDESSILQLVSFWSIFVLYIVEQCTPSHSTYVMYSTFNTPESTNHQAIHLLN